MPTESVVFLGHWGHNNPLKRISLKLRRDGEVLLHTTLQFKTQRSEGSIRKKKLIRRTICWAPMGQESKVGRNG